MLFDLVNVANLLLLLGLGCKCLQSCKLALHLICATKISGARFGFVLDEELKEAASDEEVRSALANKISRERIGHEVIFFIVCKFIFYRVIFGETF